MLGRFFHINANTFEKQYKDYLSGYHSWDQLEHASKWMLFPENIGESLCIDETSLSNGELYTIVTNRAAKGGKGSLVAMIEGVKSDVIIQVLKQIDEPLRRSVKEVTMDMSNSMHLIVKRSFPCAIRTIDRFHIQKLALEATQEMRVAHRWDAIQADTDAREEAKFANKRYRPETFSNGDTKKQLLARSRYLLYKSADKWTDSQKERAKILFKQYPDLEEAYRLTHSLRMIFSKNTNKDVARLSLAKWYEKVDQHEFHSFKVIAATIYEHYNEILNFFVNRSTNAYAESFNAKIKSFRALLRGIADVKFFMFRLAKIYA